MSPPSTIFYIYKVFLIIPYLFIQLYMRGREPSMTCRREKTSPIPMALPSTPTLNLLRFCPFISPNKQRSNFLFSCYGTKKTQIQKSGSTLTGVRILQYRRQMIMGARVGECISCVWLTIHGVSWDWKLKMIGQLFLLLNDSENKYYARCQLSVGLNLTALHWSHE